MSLLTPEQARGSGVQHMPEPRGLIAVWEDTSLPSASEDDHVFALFLEDGC